MSRSRLGHRKQLLLLAAAASVPISLGLTAWPPAVPKREVIVVQAIAPTPAPSACGETPESGACVQEPVVEVEPVIEPVVEPAVPAWELEVPGFAWVVGGQVVLSTTPDEAWAAGPVQALDEDGSVVRAVSEEALPQGIRAARGTRVDVYADDGTRCSGVIEAPQLQAEVEGDLEELTWDESDDDDADREDYYERAEAERRADLAPNVWEHGRRLLVAPIALEAGCGSETRELRFARPHQEEAVAVLQPGRSGKPRAALARSFLALPELVELSGELRTYAEEYRKMLIEEAKESAGVDELDPEAVPQGPSAQLRTYLQAERWRVGEGAAAAVTVWTEGEPFEAEACGDYLSPSWGIGTVDAEGEIGKVHLGSDGHPIAMLDLEGDGQLEVLVRVSWGDGIRLMTLTESGLEERSVLESVPSFGCPC
ncbi:hypothetical protein [Paraliomyxa miuraensis]|uniref:hypothetical protein n=1 Tax=Paraliomyxa miuraensis TaxID=376150 RepID=UPI00225ABC83|nr:hypothetical protein [Paraliomyxa miuraensis]MCX4247020.1 hypothetical protein [Paraliomyxa miuraensis]